MFRPDPYKSSMISLKIRVFAGTVMLAVFSAYACGAAAPAEGSQTGKIAPAARPSGTKAGASRGPLPDPALLDGSTQAAEKKSEYGMIGDFELPGDETKSGKVGGSPGQPGQQQSQQQQQQGGMPMGIPQGAGGLGVVQRPAAGDLGKRDALRSDRHGLRG